MITELPDTIEIRHIVYQVFRALYVRYLLTYLLTYFDMYDHLGYTKTAEAYKLQAYNTIVCYLMHEIRSVVSQENHRNCCHKMSHFKAKMHQIRVRLGLRPRPRWRSLQRSPDS